MQPASGQLIVHHDKNSVQRMTGAKDNYAINEGIINLFAKLKLAFGFEPANWYTDLSVVSIAQNQRQGNKCRGVQNS